MTEFAGHDVNWARFERALAGERLHHGWLLAGPRGIGKAGFALRAARRLVDPEGRYAAMVDHRTHPDIIWVQRLPKEPPKEGEEADPHAELKRSIGVDQIRTLQHHLALRPSMGEKRAVIIDAADDFERSAANALLKSLEEPPVGTYFFLVSHASDRLLPTIRSRCQIMRFDPLLPDDMRSLLCAKAPDLEPEEIETLVRAGGGCPGQALLFAGLDLAELEQAMDLLLEKGDPSNKLRAKLAETLSLKPAQRRYEAFLRRVPQRIADHARGLPAENALPAIDAFHAAEALAGRAIGLSLDKQSVVFEMGSLLASLQAHKQAAN